MASIRTRKRKDGTTSHHVLWREVDGTQTSMKFDDHQTAENFRRVMTANGHNVAAADLLLKSTARGIPSLAKIAEQHVTGLASVSERTRADYRRQIVKHIVPGLGSLPVDRISTQDVRDWVNNLAEGELADKTIQVLHGLLSAIMTTAVERGHRDANPCRGVRLPRRKAHERVEMTFLTTDEWHAIDEQLGIIAGGHYRLAFRVLAGTGMRWGELGGLQPADLNLTATPALLRISRSLKRDSRGAMFLGPTKTRRSVRSISIPDDLAAQLAEHVKTRPAGEQLFRSPGGPFLDQHQMRTNIWQKAVAASGVPKRPRIHDLRHSHASWLIAAGVDLLTVQRRLGHESITTTADTYSHLLPGQQQSAADAVAAALGAVTSR